MPKSTVLNLQSHDILARKRGEVVWWWASQKCTCAAARKTIKENRDTGKISHDSLRADLVCSVCGGNGFFWPVRRKIKAVVLDVNTGNSRELLAAGLATPGDLMMSPAPLGMRSFRISDFDKIIFPHRGGQPHAGDVLIRGQFDNGLIDIFPHPLGEITKIAYKSGSSMIYPEEGADYTYAKYDNEITWIDGGPNVPPDGTPFSVSCHVYYEWIAFASPFERVENDNLLGSKVLLKKKHLVGLT